MITTADAFEMAAILREELTLLPFAEERENLARTYERDAEVFETAPNLSDLRHWAPVYLQHARNLRAGLAEEATVKRIDLDGNVTDTFQTESELNGWRASQGRLM